MTQIRKDHYVLIDNKVSFSRIYYQSKPYGFFSGSIREPDFS